MKRLTKLLILIILSLPLHGMTLVKKRSLEEPYPTLGEWILLADLPKENVSYKQLKVQRGYQLRRFASLNYISLCLSDQGHKVVPVGIFGLDNIKGLDLSTNCLTSVDGIETLTTLQELYLSYNYLKKLPKGFGGLPLRRLCLVDNELTEIEEVSTLRALTLLGLGHNRLTALPCLNELTNLEQLCAQHNRLTTVPQELSRCTKLQRLGLHSNYIKTLPFAWDGLKNLQYLWLANNKLEELPPSLASLRNLKVLNIMDNPLGKGPKGKPASLRFMLYTLAGRRILRCAKQLLDAHIALKGVSKKQLSCKRPSAHTQSMRLLKGLLPCLLSQLKHERLKPTKFGCIGQELISYIRLHNWLTRLCQAGGLLYGNAADSTCWTLTHEEETQEYRLPKGVRGIIVAYLFQLH